MKYNFKRGDQVEIYRTPVDGLGVEVSDLPPVGSKGVVDSEVLTCAVDEKSCPFVYIVFKINNRTVKWALPCSCLKRVPMYFLVALKKALSI